MLCGDRKTGGKRVTLPRGWLARGLDSAKREFATWQPQRRERLLASGEFRITPKDETMTTQIKGELFELGPDEMWDLVMDADVPEWATSKVPLDVIADHCRAAILEKLEAHVVSWGLDMLGEACK